MPFVKKSETKQSEPSTDTHKIFIGRESELLFFVQNILKPEDPTHNIISISGQGGVGKSTLLVRLIAETTTSDFKGYCRTALVDDRQTTPVSMMEKFADQLQMKDEFDRALKRYKETLRKLQTDRETMQDAILHRVPDFASAAVEGVPIVGPILREGVKATTGYLSDKYYSAQERRDVERLEDLVGALTRAFVKELNRLTDTQVTHGFNRTRQLRVVLFFDTFEQLSIEAAPWLLNHFLPSDINNNVVLVVAGRDPVERSTSDDPKRWLPYYDNDTIYPISLNSFTKDETSAYLAKRGIADPKRVDTIWQLSRGLPLYLNVLTFNPRGKVDPAADVVANFLRWIPEEEQIKRRLALDAALFSKPFDQDDLEAFTYLSRFENEQSSIYRWLIGQPFVLPQEGRYRYHDLARELFSHHLYQRSKKKYYGTRRALANHYQRLLEKTKIEGGEEVHNSIEWMELVQALVYQLFLLPDEASHIKAIEQVLNFNEHTEQVGEIVRILRELSQEQSDNRAHASARQAVKYLLQYIEADLGNQEFLEAVNRLLEKVSHEPSFSSKLLAHLFCERGQAYFFFKEYERACEDYNHALELDAMSALTYGLLGSNYLFLNEYHRAIDNFNRALELNPRLALAYVFRGEAYRLLEEYGQAITNFDSALELDSKLDLAFVLRGETYRLLAKYQRAIEDYDHALELDFTFARAYVGRGETYRLLEVYGRAIEDYDRALELDPKSVRAYVGRGTIYRLLKEYKRAIQDFDRTLELNPQFDWIYVERGQILVLLNEDQQAIEDLNHALELNPKSDQAYYFRGLAHCSLGEYLQAIEDFDRALTLNPEAVQAYAERGEAYRLLGEYRRAIEDLSQALALDPQLAQVYAERGETYRLLEEFERAIEDFDHALGLDAELAWVYGSRGETYRLLNENRRAIEDFDRALTLNPKLAWVYGSRGQAHFSLNENWLAIEDFSRALELDPKLAWIYDERGETYRVLNEYRKAIADFDRALELDPKYAWAYAQRGLAYRDLKEYERAIESFNQALLLDSSLVWVYAERGEIYYFFFKEYERAIKDFNRAIELNPKYARAYSSRGNVLLLLKNINQARADLALSWKLDPKNVNCGWLVEWSRMCLEGITMGTAERLETIVAVDPHHYTGHVCQAVVLWLHKRYEEALAELEQAISLASDKWDAYFWKGMVYASLERNKDAMEALEKSLDMSLPVWLMTLLYCFKETRPDFYKQCAMQLLVRR